MPSFDYRSELVQLTRLTGERAKDHEKKAKIKS
jgi:hypothetical protein